MQVVLKTKIISIETPTLLKMITIKSLLKFPFLRNKYKKKNQNIQAVLKIKMISIETPTQLKMIKIKLLLTFPFLRSIYMKKNQNFNP